MQQQAAKANLAHMDLFTGRRITLFYNFVTTILVSMEHLFAAMAKNWARDTWEL